MTTASEQTGRVNQKLRTRMAIVEACREVIRSGGPVRWSLRNWQKGWCGPSGEVGST